MLKGFANKKLRVTATAYSSHSGQTDGTPFLAAWNNRLRPGMKIIAVSRDLLSKYGLKNGSKVKIGGLRGYYTVRDKMNKRYKKRIDIYMGMNRRKALRWGKRSVILYY
jgi:3D (Asp-Asp-Asp) domain-containing protein